jgi:hypothetical protein
MMAHIRSISAAFILFSGLGVQGAEVSGTIASSTTWSLSGSPYIVMGSVTVAEGATLTIDPGVTIQFRQFQGLWVAGHLQAVGTVGNPIVFGGSTAQRGWWRGIHLTGEGSAQMDWCDVAHAGYSDSVGIAALGTGSLTIRNSTVREHQGDGLRLSVGYAALTSQNNSFRDCTRGVRLGTGATWDDASSSFTGNTVDLHADGGTTSGNVVWAMNPAYSVYLAGSVTIGAGTSLTVRPGTVVKVAQFSGLWVDGHLEARGTAVSPVYFTDWRDDAVGGDANGNGSESGPAAGWWRGIFVREAGSAALGHGTLRYSGYHDSGGLFKSGLGDLTLDHWNISRVSGYGLKVQNSTGTTLLQQSTFADNSESGLYLKSSAVTATDCVYTGNGTFGVLHEAGDGLDYSGQQFSGNNLGSVGVNGGMMAADRTWSLGGGGAFTVVVRGSLTVPPESTLTVEPGVVVQFAQFVPLYVQGGLSAVGAADLPIRFEGTTTQEGWWRGIQLSGVGSAHLERCEIAHAGYSEGAGVLVSGTGALTLRHSTLRDHTGDALRLAPGNNRVTSQDNVFRNCTRGVRLGLGATWDDTTSDFSANTVNLFADAGTLTNEVVWALKPSYSIHLNGNTTLAETARLTVRPGTVLKFAQFGRLLVNGRLDAVGTAALPIVFTDWRDDTVGGDANGDGSDSAAAPGWWRGLFVSGAGSAVLERGTARYAGYHGTRRRGENGLGRPDHELLDRRSHDRSRHERCR